MSPPCATLHFQWQATGCWNNQAPKKDFALTLLVSPIIAMSLCLTGSLAHSVSDPFVALAGASGGCYALIGAHVATIITVSSMHLQRRYVERLFSSSTTLCQFIP